jgi:hypothetical protein
MKLRRANELYQLLSDDIASFYAKNPYQFEFRPFDLGYRLYIHKLKSPPPRWGMQVGDIVHNARAALDHMAYSLALSNGKTPDQARRGSFPVVPGDATAFNEATVVKKMRRLLRPADQERIEHLQLFNANNRDIWPWLDGPSSAGTPGRLRILSALDNEDKHRTLRIVGHAVGDARYDPPVPEPYKATHITNLGLLTDGESFAEWHFDGPPAPPDVVMSIDPKEVHATYPITPRLEEPGPIAGVFFDDWELMETLRRCLATVRTVLRVFEPSVLRGEQPLLLSDALQPDPRNWERPPTVIAVRTDEGMKAMGLSSSADS